MQERRRHSAGLGHGSASLPVVAQPAAKKSKIAGKFTRQ
jgi:hypothetical protein